MVKNHIEPLQTTANQVELNTNIPPILGVFQFLWSFIDIISKCRHLKAFKNGGVIVDEFVIEDAPYSPFQNEKQTIDFLLWSASFYINLEKQILTLLLLALA